MQRSLAIAIALCIVFVASSPEAKSESTAGELNKKATDSLQKKDYKASLGFLLDEVQLLNQTGESLDLAYCYYKLGVVYGLLENFQSAIAAEKMSLRIYEKFLKADDFKLANTVEALGDFHASLNEYPEAEKFYRRLNKFYRRLNALNSRISTTHPPFINILTLI